MFYEARPSVRVELHHVATRLVLERQLSESLELRQRISLSSPGAWALMIRVLEHLPGRLLQCLELASSGCESRV